MKLAAVINMIAVVTLILALLPFATHNTLLTWVWFMLLIMGGTGAGLFMAYAFPERQVRRG